MKDFLQITENDNIILELRDFKKNETIHLNGKNIQIKKDISRGHKIAVKDIMKMRILLNTAIQSGMHWV
jgi:altronate hydrolase